MIFRHQAGRSGPNVPALQVAMGSKRGMQSDEWGKAREQGR